MKPYPYPQFTGDELQAKLYELAHQCNDAEDAFNDALYTLTLLEGIKKEHFAALQVLRPEKSISAKEVYTLASPEWREWKQSFNLAKCDMIRCEKVRDKLKREWETCRSLLSSENAIRRTNT